MNSFSVNYLVASFSVLIIPFLSNAQQQNGFAIEGEIGGLQNNEKVIMMMINTNGLDEDAFDGMIRTDSALVNNGKFYITGYVPQGPRHYYMTFDKHSNKFIELFINNNEQIKMKSEDISKIPHSFIQHYVKIDGSLTHQGMMSLDPIAVFYLQSIGRINRCIRNVKDSVGFNGPMLEAFINSKNEINKALYYNILAGSRDPEVEKASLFLSFMLFLKSGHSSIWPDVYNKLSNDEKSSFYGKLLKEKVQICVGQDFPGFQLPTPDGKSLALKEVVSKSKITIIHFWAKNSFERKDYQDELRHLYKKYHDKGLSIIGFSTDKYKEEWTQALQESKFPWYNVVENQGSAGSAKKIYHEYSTDFTRDYFTHNTTNVVVDTQGKIIAWDVRGVELQYYLWKALGE